MFWLCPMPFWKRIKVGCRSLDGLSSKLSLKKKVERSQQSRRAKGGGGDDNHQVSSCGCPNVKFNRFRFLLSKHFEKSFSLFLSFSRFYFWCHGEPCQRNIFEWVESFCLFYFAPLWLVKLTDEHERLASILVDLHYAQILWIPSTFLS